MLGFDKKVSILTHTLEGYSRLLFGRGGAALSVFYYFMRISLIFFAASVMVPLYSFADTVEVEIVHSQDKYPADGEYPLLFNLHIASSWYIHSDKEHGDYIVATKLAFPEHSDIIIENYRFPLPIKKKFDYSDEEVELFSGSVLVKAKLKIGKKADPGTIKLDGELFYQACTTQYCLPPESIQVPIGLTVVPAGSQAMPLNQDQFAEDKISVAQSLIPEGTGFWLTLLIIFLGGMALNLTPCIYPLIPITVSYFGGKSKEIQGRTLFHGMLYVSGLSITNSILGLIASMTGSMIGQLLQQPVVLILIAGILAFLALSFFDFWEFQLPSGLTRLASKNFSGYFGTFFMGLTLGIVAAPCLGPFMLGLLTFVAQKANPVLGFVYFFVLGIGMGFPLAILAVFSGALKKLPMSGGWLMWIRRALGWVLVVMSGYMLMPLISSSSGKSALIAIILAIAGLHLGWLDRSTSAMRIFPYIKKGLGMALICTSAFLFLVPTSNEIGESIKWRKYDAAILKEAAEKKYPVILDFYADWCTPCRALDKKVFMDPEVIGLSEGFVPIRIDLTTKHPFQEEIQERFKIKGVPTIIFINKNGVIEEEKFESFVDRDVFLERMKQLLKQS